MKMSRIVVMSLVESIMGEFVVIVVDWLYTVMFMSGVWVRYGVVCVTINSQSPPRFIKIIPDTVNIVIENEIFRICYRINFKNEVNQLKLIVCDLFIEHGLKLNFPEV